MFDDETAHHARRVSHESRAIRKRRAASRSHVQVRLMKECCRAQCHRKAVPSELTLSNPMQFGIKRGEQCSSGGTVTAFGSRDKRRKTGFHLNRDSLNDASVSLIA